MKNIMTVNNIKYSIDKLLGHGKGGYSYLAMKDDKPYVLKQIHHEPCDYYTFGNKIEAERYDYNRLLKTVLLGVAVAGTMASCQKEEISSKHYAK